MTERSGRLVGESNVSGSGVPGDRGDADPDRAANGAAVGPPVDRLSFDDAFAELRAVVAELETGGLSLEHTIARTERAVALQRHCERLLGEAELRVQQLISRPGGGLELRDIAAEDATEG